MIWYFCGICGQSPFEGICETIVFVTDLDARILASSNAEINPSISS